MIVYILNKFSRTRKMLYTLPIKYRRHLFYLYQVFTIVIFLFGATSFLCLVFASQLKEIRTTFNKKNGSMMAGDLPSQQEYIDQAQNFDIRNLQDKRVTDREEIDKLKVLIKDDKAIIDAQGKEIDKIYSFGFALGVIITFMTTCLELIKKLLSKPAELLIRKDDK